MNNIMIKYLRLIIIFLDFQILIHLLFNNHVEVNVQSLNHMLLEMLSLFLMKFQNIK